MLTFVPGEIGKTVTVVVNGDRLAKPNETLECDCRVTSTIWETFCSTLIITQ